MSKIVPVLCITKENEFIKANSPVNGAYSTLSRYLPKIPDNDLAFISRTICDHKLDDNAVANSFLQLLPYCVVYRKKNDGTIAVLTYDRGNGAEARLHTNSSIGFGGHIDYDDATKGESFNLYKTIFNGLCRELNEELGVPVEYVDNHVKPIGTIIDYTNIVGQRHLCLAYALKAPDDFKITDCSEIANPRWESLDRLLARCNFEPTDTFNVPSGLESWSEKVISLLLHNIV